MPKPSGQFKFLKHDTIGANAAEDDSRYLIDCFVDTGELNHLLDLDDHRCIVLGRTGSGKTAILKTLCRRSNARSIEPESLSLNYIANSTIIRFFHELGVNLDPFYKLLWRHLFAVEVFKDRFDIINSDAKKNFFLRLFESKAQKKTRTEEDRRRRRALDYVERFSESFWEDTEFRTKEITNSFESELRSGVRSELSATLGGKFASIGAGIDSSNSELDRLTTEERTELRIRGQGIVNSIQVKQLSEIIDLVHEVVQDHGVNIIFVIDRLDEQWADDSIRYRLIRALIDTSREFRRVRGVKIILGMRNDLVERVFRRTRDSGFQEEKYRSLYLPIQWERGDLIRLIDTRIAKLVKDRVSKARITHEDIFPPGIVPRSRRKAKPIDFFIERSWNRPRDLIEFINMCLSQAKEKTRLTKSMIMTAEGRYSIARLRSLIEEWHADYPILGKLIDILKKRPSEFRLSELKEADLTDVCVDLASDFTDSSESLRGQALNVIEKGNSIDDFRSKLTYVLYRVGAIGLKTDTFIKTQWATENARSVSVSDIDDDTLISIHPALWRVLGIKELTASS